jgi:hypothetical protein
LRIIDDQYFEVVWTCDAWQTKQTTPSRSLGYAGHSADLIPGDGSNQVEWTLHRPQQDTWLGYNVRVKIDAM